MNDPTLPPAPPADRPFADDSPFNTPIPSNVRTSPQSAAMLDATVRRGGAQAKLYEYGYPIVEADQSSPLRTVTCTGYGGRCDLANRAVPVPDDAAPNSGSDGALVVIDRSAGVTYEFFQFRRSGSEVAATWASTNSLSGSGAGNGGSGSGISRLAGVVRTSEIEALHIPHALTVSVSNACRDRFVAPATSTDGRSEDASCIPQGSRLQLDPSIDLARIRGITPGELAVGRALQVYGAFVVDSGRSAMAVNFELPTSGADPYPAAGFLWDYYTMRSLPWESLRVLD